MIEIIRTLDTEPKILIALIVLGFLVCVAVGEFKDD